MKSTPLLSPKELTELLVKHYDLHEGRYALALEFAMGFGMIGPTHDQSLPGAMLGLSKLGIKQVEDSEVSPHTVDASEVNPAKKPRRKAVAA